MIQDVVRTGTHENTHYVIYRTDPHWFKADVYDAKGKLWGTTWYHYTIKKAWSDVIGFIAICLAKEN